MTVFTSAPVLIGTAGWTVPRAVRDRFAETGSSLERYASRFPVAEINSSFHRPHRRETYERWAASTPPDFRFAVKIPKTISHERALVDVGDELDRFLGECAGLGDKLGPLLLQLPPKRALDETVALAFFAMLRDRVESELVCEPRHASWFTAEAEALLRESRVARVAADPARVPGADVPGGWLGLIYYRLHGSPRMYYSSYSAEWLAALAHTLDAQRATRSPTWCIFDNTASGAAAEDGLELVRLMSSKLP